MAKRRARETHTHRIERLVFADGSFLEGSMTQFRATARQPAGIDYRLAYIAADGTVVVLYDNQAGHAPHRHIRGRREPYELASIDRLVDDFLADVDRVRKE